MTGGLASAGCPLDVLPPSGAIACLLASLFYFNLSDVYYFVCSFGLTSFHSKTLLVMREQGWSFSLFLKKKKKKNTIGRKKEKLHPSKLFPFPSHRQRKRLPPTLTLTLQSNAEPCSCVHSFLSLFLSLSCLTLTKSHAHGEKAFNNLMFPS